MAVKRIVANIRAGNMEEAGRFYGDILDLKLAMDHGWIMTWAADNTMVPQVSIAREGGAGTAVPDLSIEVDNLDEVYQRVVAARLPVDYALTEEAWGVRRFYVRDPFGRLINILSHVP
ncbi:VOC family protein [Pantoea ananatis]|uniref:VOC family protein n=1 Tax=Pantoea ananas TaxID=553 RepID=UPI001B30812E|nr:VOC family protein [Pantoea ananatis]